MVTYRKYKGETAWYVMVQDGDRWQEFKWWEEPTDDQIQQKIAEWTAAPPEPQPTVLLELEDGGVV